MAFKPGQSGNPKGRPRGRPDRRTAWRNELEPKGKALVTKAVEMALSGDAQALRLCLERLTPAYKPQAEPVRFELKGETLTEKADSVLTAIAAGDLDPATGKELIAAIAGLVKVQEVDEIVRRLEALEGERNADP
ncbi:DUF5681 domain-containing protein [Halomonas organivorans]|uniref:DUF5681 domain-containing protein n=1 Tax=Halomonas organivorans TaxID=257772 RepID=A0A7W5BWP5_9GAMM|nr:DUF5681 domain-containing protein [Halomonas organivorans]MBB3140214.1 hypothetical protein [Halomonas organivorans]